MMSPDSWHSRKAEIIFMNEPDGDGIKKRKFRKISKKVNETQVIKFSKAISKLTPNGADGSVMAHVYDDFEFFADEPNGNQ